MRIGGATTRTKHSVKKLGRRRVNAQTSSERGRTLGDEIARTGKTADLDEAVEFVPRTNRPACILTKHNSPDFLLPNDLRMCRTASLRLPRSTSRQLSQWRREHVDGRRRDQDDDLVFSKPDGRPLHPDIFSNAFEPRVARTDLPRTRLHDDADVGITTTSRR